MRILFFIAQFHPIVGGAERQAHALARGLIRRGHELIVVTRRGPGWARQEIIGGVPTARELRPRGFGPLYGLTYMSCTARSLLGRPGWPDVVHVSHIYLEAFVSVALQRWHQAPVVVRPACAGHYGDLARLQRFRAWPIYPGPKQASVRRFIRTVARADAFVANSQEVAAELIEAGFPNDRIRQIPNGVDIEHFQPRSDPSAARSALGLPDGPLLVFVGRLDPQKGLENLLTAVEPELKKRRNLHVLLLGDGPLRRALEIRVRQSDLQERVLFKGVVPDVCPYLQAADVFALPSVGEGMPNALLEAMAAGLPCVASRIGGCTDVVTDGKDGLLVPPDQPGPLGRAVGQLLDSLELRKGLGAAARQTVVRGFSLERMVAAYEACYGEVACRRQEGAGRPRAAAGPPSAG